MANFNKIVTRLTGFAFHRDHTACPAVVQIQVLQYHILHFHVLHFPVNPGLDVTRCHMIVGMVVLHNSALSVTSEHGCSVIYHIAQQSQWRLWRYKCQYPQVIYHHTCPSTIWRSPVH